jgi:hypothetical protein
MLPSKRQQQGTNVTAAAISREWHINFRPGPIDFPNE